MPTRVPHTTPDTRQSQACPRGAVGVGGVDLRPVTAATESHRFSCVGAELPMLMRRDGTARIHEVGSRFSICYAHHQNRAALVVVVERVDANAYRLRVFSLMLSTRTYRNRLRNRTNLFSLVLRTTSKLTLSLYPPPLPPPRSSRENPDDILLHLSLRSRNPAGSAPSLV